MRAGLLGVLVMVVGLVSGENGLGRSISLVHGVRRLGDGNSVVELKRKGVVTVNGGYDAAFVAGPGGRLDVREGEVYVVGTEEVQANVRGPAGVGEGPVKEVITLHGRRRPQSGSDITRASEVDLDQIEIYHVSYKVFRGVAAQETKVVIDLIDPEKGPRTTLQKQTRRAAADDKRGQGSETIGGADGVEEVETPEPEKTLFQKYGIYLIPLVIVFLFSGGGGGGQ
ncbi:hypothetical protein PYCC9005_005180 [Savitreella phatthalungensis]